MFSITLRCLFSLTYIIGSVSAYTVTDLSRSLGAIDTLVTITGEDFDPAATYEVLVGDTSQGLALLSGNELDFQVAAGTTGGAVSIREDGELRDTGFFFEVTQPVVFTAKLPGALNPAGYRLVTALEQDLGPIVDGGVVGMNSMIRATVAGVIAGDDESALFAVVPPGATSVEVSPLSHAVATVFMAPGVIGEAGEKIDEALKLIEALPAVRDLARFVESAAVPNFDFIDSSGYREKVEGALKGYLAIKDLDLVKRTPLVPSPPGDFAEHPVQVKNLNGDPSPVRPVSLRVSVEAPGGRHPNHYLMKVDHLSPVVQVDFSIEVSRVNPNSLPQGRQTVRSANSSTNYTYLDNGPIFNGYKTASFFSSVINVVEFLVVNGPDAFPGLQAGFNDLAGFPPDLLALASPNNFLIHKDFVGVLAVHSYSGNLWHGTSLGFAPNDPRSQIGLLDEYDRFNRWELALGTNLASGFVDLASIFLDLNDFAKGSSKDASFVLNIADKIATDVTKEAANINTGTDYRRLIFAIAKKAQEEFFEMLLSKGITGVAKAFGKKAGKNATVVLGVLSTVSAVGQFGERMVDGLIGPKHYAMERSLVVFNDPFEPRINSFHPREGRAGDYISISGNNFSTVEGQPRAFFCTLPATAVADESPQSAKRLEAEVQVSYDSFIGINVPDNASWDAVFRESDTVYLCVETGSGMTTTTYSNADPNRTFTYIGPPRLDAVDGNPYPGSLMTLTGSRFHQERQGPLEVLIDGEVFRNGVIMNNSESVLTLELPANLEPGSHTVQLKIGEQMSQSLSFTVLPVPGELVGSERGLEVTVTHLDFNNVADGELSLGEALLILNGAGLGRSPTQRPENPPPPAGARFESDHISGQGTGPLFENKMTILGSLNPSEQEVVMPASFAPLLAAQAGDTLDACFLTFDLSGANFPGFDYDGVSGGRLSNFTLKNFTGPGITIRGGTTGLRLEGVGLDGLTGNGLTISGGAHHNAINNLRVANASGHGIHITGPGTKNNKIRFGFGTNLPIGAPEGRIENCAQYGVLVDNGAQYNQIQPGTVIGNTQGGIRIEGADTDHNLVGINSDIRFRPVYVLKNGGHGVYLGSGVEGTLIRYVTAVGNTGDGFRLEGPNCANNNLKGLETVPAFEFGLPMGDLVEADRNTGHGIHLLSGARDNLIGEESSTNWGFGERSTITHNIRSGIVLDGPETTGNVVNHLNVGDAALSNENSQLFTPINGEHGIVLQNGAHHNIVGDLAALRDIHLTSLPNGAGVMIDSAHFNEVFGCHIGTIHGQPLRPDFGVGPIKWGIVLKNGARGNQVGRAGEDHFLSDPDHIFGGFYSLPYNFIGFATEAGILLDGTITTSPDPGAIAAPNHIINNAIGFGQNNGPAPNKVGIRVTGNAVGNVVGGPLETMGNRIRGNEDYGVHFLDYDIPLGSDEGARNFFQWNVIENTGLDAAAVADPLDQLNRGIGVVFENSSRATFGETINETNLIQNNFQGVFFDSSTQCRVRGTKIDEINHAGVVCRNSLLSEVGGPDASEKNQITRTGKGGASDSASIAINGGSLNIVANNLIGLDSDAGSVAGSHGPGILVRESFNNTIGGTFRENGNVILGSAGAGVLVTGNAATGNKIQRNFIGTDRDYAAGFPNGGGGVVFEGGARDNLLGGKGFVGIPGTPGFRGLLAGNVIIGNTGWGVSVSGGVGNQILNNQLIGNSTGPIQLTGGGNRLLAPPEGVFDGNRVTGSVDDLVSTPAGSLVQVFSGNSAFEAANFMSEGFVQADGSFNVFTGPSVLAPVVTMTITSSVDDSTSTLGRTRFPIDNPNEASVEFRLGTLNGGGNELDGESGNQAVMALEVEGRNVGAFLNELSFMVSGTLVDQDLAALGSVALWHDRNGDGVLGFGDIELDRISPSGNGPFLEFAPDFQIEVNETEELLVSIDLPNGAAGGRTFQLALFDDTDVTAKLASGLDLIVPVTGMFPLTGTTWSTVDTGVVGLYIRSFAEAATASLADLEMLADPDGDGFSNLIEYALGTHPFQADGSGSFQVRSEDGHGLVEYTYPSDRTDVLFGVSSSYGLGSLGGGPELLEEISRESDANEGTTTVTLRTILEVPPGFEFFARLLVQK